MIKRIFAVAAAASVSLLGATAAATAQAAPHARPTGHLHGVRVINLHRAFEARLAHVKPGKISGIVYARGHKPRRAANTAATCTEPACPVTWHGGPVQHTPHVYLLLWGPNWGTDPNQVASAAYLKNFFSGLGNGQAADNWSTITSQYADSRSLWPPSRAPARWVSPAPVVPLAPTRTAPTTVLPSRRT